MISIVIPLYNKEKQAKNTLQTVFNQTFQEFEIIIVNDGSTDNSLETVQQLTDERIKIINQENQGVSAARNRGIEEAKYEYIALLDADDEWKSTYLEAQVGLIKDFPDCSIFACGYQFKYVDRIEPLILNRIPFLEKKGILTNYFEVAVHSHPPLCSSTVVARKQALLSVGGFPEGIIEGEDLLTWAKLAVRYPIAYHLECEAFFVKDQTENYSGEIFRIKKEKHNLGKQFEILLKENPKTKGLKQYTSHWYKMRASMFLLLGYKKESAKESVKSLKYNLLNWKVWIYLFLLLSPKTFALSLFRKFGNS